MGGDTSREDYGVPKVVCAGVSINWQPINTAPSFETVLTAHFEDLYPVPAFFVEDPGGGGQWMREAEGPEDTYDGRAGKHEPLYRNPTHWARFEMPKAPAAQTCAWVQLPGLNCIGGPIIGWRPACWEGQDRSTDARNYKGPHGRTHCPYCQRTIAAPEQAASR